MKLKILYLYSEIVGYQIPVLKEYVSKYMAEVYVIHWDKKKLKPYEPPNLYKIHFIKKSEYKKKALFKLCERINPSIIYVSGWMDRDYLFICRKLKKRGIPIVTGFDDTWTGSIKQRLGILISPFLIRKYFSHAWVAGPYQFEYAKKIGFRNKEIIFDLLTANTDIYQIPLKKQGSDKNFLYVGNFRKIKGIDILIDAFRIYKDELHGSWGLICVGNGEYEQRLKETGNISLFPFSDEKMLIEIAKKASVFILPSRHDQWGVVVHEFTSLGMPLLLSEFVGARTTFLIEGYNGYIFKNNSSEDLAKKMSLISSLSAERLSNMGDNSRQLASRINISTSAANFMSILLKNNNE